MRGSHTCSTSGRSIQIIPPSALSSPQPSSLGREGVYSLGKVMINDHVKDREEEVSSYCNHYRQVRLFRESPDRSKMSITHIFRPSSLDTGFLSN